MRILPIAVKWDKLHPELPVEKRPDFTTFRLPRKDADKGRDWAVGETVQLVYRCRTPEREILGAATIVSKEPRYLATVTEAEAKADGFSNYLDMVRWIQKTHGVHTGKDSLFNKLTLRWVS